MNKIVVISIIINCVMINAMQQRAVIYPFLEQASIVAIKKTMDKIEKKGLGYPDYSGRLGGFWTDAVATTENPITLTVCKDTIKLTEVNGQLQQQNPECIFNYPKIQKIVTQEILPKMFHEIESRSWAQLPSQVSAQIFIQRCCTSDEMGFHQDPGGDYGDVEKMAAYSLLLMLSDQNDPEHGWDGGEFSIKPGLPTDECKPEEIETIIHRYNQVILFNNQYNSHMVTAVKKRLEKTKRDLLVIPIYFGDIPTPVVDYKHLC